MVIKIPFTNISIGTVNNVDQKKPANADPFTDFVPLKQAIYRTRQDLSNYKSAVLSAENVVNPQRYPLYQIYVNIVNDPHLTAAIQQRKNLTLTKSFRVKNSLGEINEEKSKLLNKQWFREWLDLSLDSLFWGHSLVMFDSVENDEFKGIELVPRQFVKPEFHIVVRYWSDLKGNDYLEEPFKDWTLGVGKTKDLGLLLKAAPLVLWKNSALGAWAEYQDNFGSPFRYLKTDIRDSTSRQNGENMMRNWGVNPWAVFDKDDIVELVESAKQDAHKVFDEMIGRLNSEISKLILGQTSTMDEKAFTGSAEVHERVAEGYADNDEHFINGVNNKQLVPLMITHGLLSEGDTIEADEAESISVIEKSKIMIELIKTGKYKMSLEEIQEEFGLELEEVEQDNSTEKTKSAIENVYGV